MAPGGGVLLKPGSFGAVMGAAPRTTRLGLGQPGLSARPPRIQVLPCPAPLRGGHQEPVSRRENCPRRRGQARSIPSSAVTRAPSAAASRRTSATIAARVPYAQMRSHRAARPVFPGSPALGSTARRTSYTCHGIWLSAAWNAARVFWWPGVWASRLASRSPAIRPCRGLRLTARCSITRPAAPAAACVVEQREGASYCEYQVTMSAGYWDGICALVAMRSCPGRPTDRGAWPPAELRPRLNSGLTAARPVLARRGGAGG